MSESEYFMPSEEAEHASTWMGFPSSKSIWGKDLVGAQTNIALIAKTISKYEPVKILISPSDYDYFQQLLDQIEFESNHPIIKIPQTINDVSIKTKRTKCYS